MQTHIPSMQSPDYHTLITDFGSILGVFQVSPSRGWIRAIFGIILVSGASLSIIYGILDSIVQIARYGISIRSEVFIYPLILALILLIPGILAILISMPNWNKLIIAYQDGLVYRDNKGMQIWKWQDIEWFNISVTRHQILGINLHTTHLYSLQSKSGARLLLDQGIKQIDLLGKIIGKNVFHHQYISLSNQIQSGKIVRLGAISIKNDFLLFKKISRGWDEIDFVEIKNGFMMIQIKGKRWFNTSRVPVSAISNIDPLIAFITQKTRVLID